MVQTIIQLDNNLDKFVKIFAIEQGIKTKAQAINKIISLYKEQLR